MSSKRGVTLLRCNHMFNCWKTHFWKISKMFIDSFTLQSIDDSMVGFCNLFLETQPETQACAVTGNPTHNVSFCRQAVH